MSTAGEEPEVQGQQGARQQVHGANMGLLILCHKGSNPGIGRLHYLRVLEERLGGEGLVGHLR